MTLQPLGDEPMGNTVTPLNIQLKRRDKRAVPVSELISIRPDEFAAMQAINADLGRVAMDGVGVGVH